MKFVQQRPPEVHPMKEYRRVPLAQLRKRLQVEEYERETPFVEVRLSPAEVRIKMRQHAGEPAVPCVAEGQKVKQGQVVGRVADSQLGAHVHASISGTVRRVSADSVAIAR
jgi:Na+-translocating ferredoxin:NAD+ oxidoreductase RnfC subunit